MADDDRTTADDHDPGATPEPRSPETASPARRRSPWLRRLPLLILAVVVAGAGLVVWLQVKPVLSARRYRDVLYRVPTAPQLTPGPGETVYRIDPTQSSLTYSIGEHFIGQSGDSTATGTTNGLAGDIAIDPSKADGVRFGKIVANVEQFHSDNNLRDARLRQDFLQSHDHPLSSFTVTKVSGLPTQLVKGTAYPFTMQGEATVHDVTKPVEWKGTATLGDDGLHAKATANTTLSAFGIGPISISGLVNTKDPVALTLEITALDPTQHAIPTSITGPHAKQATGGPSFAKEVQPILEQSCASCHNSGQVGALHWKLDTAGDASKISDGIRTVTQTGYMPPSPASDKGVALVHTDTLTKQQIDTLAAWARSGGSLDVPASTPIKPSKAAQALQPRQDVVLHVPGYTGSLQKDNDYRCFVLQPNITTTQYMTGYTFLADQVEELHHAQVFHISSQQAANAEAMSGKDGQPGWSCYGGVSVRGAKPVQVPGRTKNHDVGFAGQQDLVAGWVPGQNPVIFPDGAGILMNPGDALVLQVHYHYDDQVTEDHSGLALQLDAPTPTTKALRVINPLAPVELPCEPGATEPLCNRSAAIADNIQKFGTNDEDALLALCHTSAQELAAQSDGRTARTTCNLSVPESGTIIGVFGHEHTLGKTFRLTLDPGTPQEKILLDIPNWNFDWQMNYQLATPLHVTAGEPVQMECTWDRSLDPYRPQRYVVFAEDTESEMCFGTYALIPDNQ